jgi:hypothetical protein
VTDGRRRGIGLLGFAYAIATVACLGTAAQATLRIRTLNDSADWIDLQLKSEESDYEATLQSRFIDQELQGFRERHRVLTASSAWWQIRLGLMMFWVLASFAFYVYRVITSFSQEVTQGPPLALPLARPTAVEG